MCDLAQSFRSLKSTPLKPADSYGDRSYDSAARSYLSSVSSSVQRLRRNFGDVPRLGFDGANRLVDAYVQALDRIGPELGQLDVRAFDTPAEQQRQRATRAAELVASVAEPSPGLETVASGDASLARAYDFAPRCDPRGRQRVVPPPPPAGAAPAKPLPVAANGTDLAACASGGCEVLIDKPTDVTVDRIVY